MHLPDRTEFDKAVDAARHKYPDIARAAAAGVLDMAVVGAGLGTTSASDVVGAALNKARIEHLPNYNITAQFHETYEQTVKLFDRIDITAPTLAEFQTAGVDFAHLATEYERMKREELDPLVVIAPSLPLHSFGQYLEPSWQSLYKRLTEDTTIPNNPLKHSLFKRVGDDSGLYIDSSAYNSAHNFFEHETNRLDTKPTASDSQGHRWFIALVPGTDKPQELGSNYSKHEYNQLPISAYLTMEAVRIQAGKPPINKHNWCWLNEKFRNEYMGLAALFGAWDSHKGQIRVDWEELGDSRSLLGVRLPVW